MTEAELLACLRLARTEGVGPANFRRLLRRFTTAAEALDALPGLASAGGRATPPTIPPLAAIRREMDGVAKLGGRILVLGGPDYPPLLALMDSAPPAIAVLGAVAALAAPRAGAGVGGFGGTRALRPQALAPPVASSATAMARRVAAFTTRSPRARAPGPRRPTRGRRRGAPRC